MRLFRSRRLGALLSLAALAFLGACEDGPTATPANAEGFTVVLNSRDRTLTLVPILGTGPTRTVELGPEGTPTTLSVFGIRAVVPMGNYPFAKVVNLQTRQVEHTVALPQNSGATGVDFLNDSVAVVVNPNRNSVTPVNVLRGTAGAEVAVGQYPQAVVGYNNRMFVLNAHLDPVTFAPTRNGTITVLSSQLTPLGTVELSGRNPIAAVGRAQTLYVLNAGDFGANNGSLSTVDPAGLSQEGHYTGFGDFPSSIAFSPATQEVYVSTFGNASQLLVWDPFSTEFIRGLENPLRPGITGPYSALGFDPLQQLHVLKPGNCTGPGQELRMLSMTAIDRTTSTGVCPISLDFVILPLENS